MPSDDESIRDAAAAVLRSTPSVAAAWIFGSFARGSRRVDSDLDVAVLFCGSSIDPAEVLDLAARLEQATARRIDLAILGVHDPILMYEVLSTGLLVCDSNRERRLDVTTDALARYLDWAPSFEATAARSLAANARWARGAAR